MKNLKTVSNNLDKVIVLAEGTLDLKKNSTKRENTLKNVYKELLKTKPVLAQAIDEVDALEKELSQKGSRTGRI